MSGGDHEGFVGGARSVTGSETPKMYFVSRDGPSNGRSLVNPPGGTGENFVTPRLKR